MRRCVRAYARASLCACVRARVNAHLCGVHGAPPLAVHGLAEPPNGPLDDPPVCVCVCVGGGGGGCVAKRERADEAIRRNEGGKEGGREGSKEGEMGKRTASSVIKF